MLVNINRHLLFLTVQCCVEMQISTQVITKEHYEMSTSCAIHVHPARARCYDYNNSFLSPRADYFSPVR